MQRITLIVSVPLLLLAFSCVGGGDGSDPSDDVAVSDVTNTDLIAADLIAADLIAADTGVADVPIVGDAQPGIDTSAPDVAEVINPTDTADTAGPADVVADSGAGKDVPQIPEDAGSPADVAQTPEPPWADLAAVPPTGETALPEFSAVVNQDGETFETQNLLGMWSVLWFYPAASTAG
jgi:hypothetical protein